MKKIAIVTDSNAGITKAEADELGVFVLPMPVYINDELYYEGLDLTQEKFYEFLMNDSVVHTSMPIVGEVTDFWDELLKSYDEIVHIPMSSGLSSSCATALVLAEDYDGRVFVVDNQRISVTQRRSVLEAKACADKGMSGEEIRDALLKEKLDASIYIMVDTLTYLKKGGRLTPAVAAIGTALKIKPVLQIQGEKLDTYGVARTLKQAKNVMLKAVQKDFNNRFHDSSASNMYIDIAYTHDISQAEEFKKELLEIYPNHDIVINPLSLSVSCHIGPGALAIALSHKLGEKI